MTKKIITCRGIIINNGELLTIKLKENDEYTWLPGGKIEVFETLHQCLERELTEELGVKPKIGKLLFINQGLLYNYQKDLLEFFFLIENPQEYKNINLSKASHGHEIYSIEWTSIGEDNINLLPKFIITELKNGIENINAKIIIST